MYPGIFQLSIFKAAIDFHKSQFIHSNSKLNNVLYERNAIHHIQLFSLIFHCNSSTDKVLPKQIMWNAPRCSVLRSLCITYNHSMVKSIRKFFSFCTIYSGTIGMCIVELCEVVFVFCSLALHTKYANYLLKLHAFLSALMENLFLLLIDWAKMRIIERYLIKMHENLWVTISAFDEF